MEFTVVRGDFVTESADALVNAAGTSLRMDSGVAGALRRGASGPIDEEVTSEGPVDLGEIAVTDAYDLNAEYVIHAAAMPDYGGGGRATTDSVRRSTRKSLEKADELGYASIVIPILGTGAAGFDFEEGARLVYEEVRQHEPTSVTDARVITYSQPEYETLERVAEDVRAARA